MGLGLAPFIHISETSHILLVLCQPLPATPVTPATPNPPPRYLEWLPCLPLLCPRLCMRMSQTTTVSSLRTFP